MANRARDVYVVDAVRTLVGRHAGTLSGVCPRYHGAAPVEAVRRALSKAGRRFADLCVMELNGAYAGQALVCLSQRPELDPAVVNPCGGAIAIGHPLGASGARPAGAVARQLAGWGRVLVWPRCAWEWGRASR